MELQKLKEVRVLAGYSNATMARLLGISKVYYWQLENGNRRLYYFMAIKIAKVFKTTPDVLFYKDFN